VAEAQNYMKLSVVHKMTRNSTLNQGRIQNFGLGAPRGLKEPGLDAPPQPTKGSGGAERHKLPSPVEIEFSKIWIPKMPRISLNFLLRF